MSKIPNVRRKAEKGNGESTMLLPQFAEITKTDVPFPNPTRPKFSFIDLFAGIGGFRIAMRNCGGTCVFSSEFDPYAQKTYEANFGEVPAGDITKQATHDLIPAQFDIVCAGFLCQAFSLAGKRQGFNDNFKGLSRGTLFQEVVRICEKHRPKAVFCENVKGLYIHDCLSVDASKAKAGRRCRTDDWFGILAVENAMAA